MRQGKDRGDRSSEPAANIRPAAAGSTPPIGAADLDSAPLDPDLTRKEALRRLARILARLDPAAREELSKEH